MANLAYIQLTRVCNQRCRFCSNPANDRLVSVDKVLELLDLYSGRKAHGVIFTGGEPTLHPELREMLQAASRKGLPARIITNGQLTSDRKYLRMLADSGLNHVNVSLYSCRDKTQRFLTGKSDSLKNILRTLENLGALGLRADVNTVINSYNADHLSETVRRIVESFPFVKHFVWNNLDPMMGNASKHRDTIPRLADFELELHRAMLYLDSTRRTFRVERVPLCFMTDFAHRSTETRKIVKGESRTIYFLDERKLSVQDKRAWTYGKVERCRTCSLFEVCAGLYAMGEYFSPDELCPVFVPKEPIVARVLEKG